MNWCKALGGLRLVLLGLMILLNACGGGGGGGGGGGDDDGGEPIPEYVYRLNPFPNDAGVIEYGLVQVLFADLMDATSVNTTTFTLTDSQGKPVSGLVYYVQGTSLFYPASATFYTSHYLDPDATYTVTLSGDLRYRDGRPVETGYSWTFRTRPVFGEGSWQETSTVGDPGGRFGPTAVWTGTEMIVWGGTAQGSPLATGGRYNPVTNTWATLSLANAPKARSSHTAVWTGSEMIVFGGIDSEGNPLNDGGRYNPLTDTWLQLSSDNAPSGRFGHTAVWTGSEMIVFGGGYYGNDPLTGYPMTYFSNSAHSFAPHLNTWTTISPVGATGRGMHTAVWTGDQMLVWGGLTNEISNSGFTKAPLNTGLVYTPGSGSWSELPVTGAPQARSGHSALWTGGEMIVWGGMAYTQRLDSGGRFKSGNWTATPLVGSPLARDGHSAVWTGSEMIVWGGSGKPEGSLQDIVWDLHTGGKYKPLDDTWTPTSIDAAPAERSGHSSIWTGTQMLVWGGQLGIIPGGRYVP